ncbi:WXG100 family type VII secretion target [Actinomadura sp. DC4]|uniref:WXG100 family type VII secretion target n=1 Tax=Actinomadura sp. DC4 TaxID=3055069 RepID=UPI0025B18673|nr:WXG100 family type VII secretion target [Actinomadura sp. DC4]MDN3354932.1 WXG100 family type VII secretion target [Actinomadura sp. DC4]
MADIDGTPIYVGEGLGAAGGRINAQAGEIAGELETLKAKLAPLQEAWTLSQAATYYQDMQTEWDVAAEGLFGPGGVLAEIAQAMNVNWGNYSDAEWSNVSTWKH